MSDALSSYDLPNMRDWTQCDSGELINIRHAQGLKREEYSIGFRMPWGIEWISYKSMEQADEAWKVFAIRLSGGRIR